MSVFNLKTHLLPTVRHSGGSSTKSQTWLSYMDCISTPMASSHFSDSLPEIAVL
ncbi:hypothetical protein Hanom_Chr00s054212g01781831 [Helianthus anomalus]